MAETKTIFDSINFEILDEDIVNNGYGNCIKYNMELSFNGESYEFTYTDSVMAYRNCEEPDFKNVMKCLLLDKSAYDSCEDIDDFQGQFGYEKVSECLKAYNGCKETSEALDRVFTEEELEKLDEELEEY